MNSCKILIVASLLFLLTGISFTLTAQEKKVHVKIINNGKSTDSVYTVSYAENSKGDENQNIEIIRNSNYNGNGVESEDSIIELEVEGPDVDVQGMGTKLPRVMIMRSGNGEQEEIAESNVEAPETYSVSSGNCNLKNFADDTCMKKAMKREIVIYVEDSLHAGRKHQHVKYRVMSNNRQMENIEQEMASISVTTSKDTTIMYISPQGDTIKIHREVLKDGKIRQQVTVNKSSMDTSDNEYFTYRVRPGRNRMYLRDMDPSRRDETLTMMIAPLPPMNPDIEMNYDVSGTPQGIEENTDYGKIKVTPLMGKNMVRISLDLSSKETTVIKINDKNGKPVFEEKVKDLTGKICPGY